MLMLVSLWYITVFFFLTLEMNPYLIYLRKIIMLHKGLLLVHKLKKLNIIQWFLKAVLSLYLKVLNLDSSGLLF